MTVEVLLKWMPLIVLVVQVVMGWGMWSLGRKFMPREECEQCRRELTAKLDFEIQRTSSLDKAHEVFRAECSGLSSKGDLGKIYERIRDVDSRVAELAGVVKAQTRTLDMINQHLMRGEG